MSNEPMIAEPDIQFNPHHYLAVELEREAQHAVRGRMLRPKIDGEVANASFRHGKLSLPIPKGRLDRVGRGRPHESPASWMH